MPSPPLPLFIVILPKAHLTSHSRMSGSRQMITTSRLSESWRPFLYSSSVYSCHFLISSASVRSIPFLTDKDMSRQSYDFSSCHVWIWELVHTESWELKNWCFWTVVLEKTLESPLDCKEIKPVNPRGNLPWIFLGRTDAEAEAPIFWPPDGKNWLIAKVPNAGKHQRHEEKGRTEDEMVGWHQWLNGHEFEQTLGVGDGQGSLACCSS